MIGACRENEGQTDIDDMDNRKKAKRKSIN